MADEKEDKALRYNDGKLKWSLVHYASLAPMIQVLMFGAKKYAPNNWKKKINRAELLESMQRHLSALMDGEEVDNESKLSHMGHILCNGMFYCYHFVILRRPDEEAKLNPPSDDTI